MKNLFIFLLVISIDFIGAQTINFEQIDSNKVLNLINQENKITPIDNIISSSITQIGNENLAEINLLYNSNVNALQKGDYNTCLLYTSRCV